MLRLGASILLTAKTCLRLPEHHRVVGCRKCSACFQDVLSSLVKVHGKLVSSPDSDRPGSEEPVEESKDFLKDWAFISSLRTVDRWSVPPRLVSLQSFVVLTMQFLRNVRKISTLFEKRQAILLLKWFEKGCRRFSQHGCQMHCSL